MERALLGKLTKAIYDFGLIADGDKILIGLSGGKDSLALVELLGKRMKIFKPRFSLVAAHISIDNIPYQADLDYLKSFAEQFNIPFIHRTTSFETSTDSRKSPCFLCSWNRRKMLFDIAKETGCHKIALGHHQDDIIHTLLMNQTFQGSFSTMPPLLRMDKFDMTIIRPLCLIRETEMIKWQQLQQYRLQKKNCPHERQTYRAEMREILRQLEAMNPHAHKSIWNSMFNVQAQYLPCRVTPPEK